MSRQDGAVINHGIVHPDHMTCISHSLRAYLVQSLAGQTVPQAAEFYAELVYRTLVQTNWSSPTHQSPSGTIYVPGRAEVYYPQGTD